MELECKAARAIVASDNQREGRGMWFTNGGT